MKRAVPLLLLIFQVFILSNEAYAQNSTIVTPANNSVVPTTGFTVEVAPNPSATQRIVYITNLTTNAQYSNSGPRAGTGTLTYVVPPGLTPNTPYNIRVATWTAVGFFNTSINVTTNGTPAPSPVPVIVSPANGEVVPTSGFNVQVAANQYALQTNITVTNLANNAVYSNSPTYATTGPITYAVPPGLTGNTNYRITVTTRTSFGIYSNSVTVITNSTATPSPVPVIVSPTNNAVVPTSGFDVQVAANQYALQTNITVTNLANNTVHASSPTYATTNAIVFEVPPGLAPSTPHRITVTTRTSFGIYSASITVTSSTTPAPSPNTVILAPANGTYVLAPEGFTVQLAPNVYATRINIRINNITTGTIYVDSPTFTGAPVGTGTINYTVPDGLAPNSIYGVVVTTFTRFGIFFSQTSVSTFLPGTSLASVDGQTVDNPATVRYADQPVYPMAAGAVANATRYNWEFSVNSNFNPIAYTTTSTTPSINVSATEEGLISGQKYFVRVSGVREATGARSDASPAREFYNALHPMSLQVEVPSDLARRRFGLTSTNVVANSDEWIFQMAEADNDNDPTNDFEPGKIFTNPAAWGGNTTHPGVTGNVFKATRLKENLPWGYQAGFGTIQAQPQTTYRVRVRAARKNPNGGYHQLGYWSEARTFTTNAVPDRSHPIVNIANLATNVENRESGQFTRIVVTGMALLWDITGYQLQVSESADFTTNVVTTPSDAELLSTTSVTEGNPVFMVPNLKFSTTYYARARSVATVKGVPHVSSGWGPVTQFTTKANPAGRAVAYGQGAQSHAGDGQTVALPNPFAGSTRLRLNAAYGPLKVRVVDNLGREVADFGTNGGNEITLGEKWPKGLYLVQVYNEHSLLEVIRVVKQ